MPPEAGGAGVQNGLGLSIAIDDTHSAASVPPHRRVIRSADVITTALVDVDVVVSRRLSLRRVDGRGARASRTRSRSTKRLREFRREGRLRTRGYDCAQSAFYVAYASFDV